MLSASDLWALSHEQINSGPERCHWCGSACRRERTHDDPPPIPFVRTNTSAKCPNNAFVCVGCWLYRRGSITVNYLTGGQKDRQKAINHSWWVTEKGTWAICPDDYAELYRLLLAPPSRFSLSFRCSGFNYLQLTSVNDTIGSVIGSTNLHFTVDGTAFSYSPYELTEGLRRGAKGREPGVQTLINLLGTFSLPDEPIRKPVSPKGGRPLPLPNGKCLTRPVASGKYDY